MAGGNIGYGLSIRDQWYDGIAKGLIDNVNDLIGQHFTESWQRVPLQRQGLGARGPLRIVAELDDRRPLDRATLRFAKGQPAETRILVLATDCLRMGRKRHINDVVTRLIPRKKEEDALTETIGQAHLAIELREDGLYLCDRDTRNGTTLNGRRVRKESRVPLGKVSEVDMAGVLRLRLTPFRATASEEAEAATRYGKLGAPDAVWTKAAKLGLRSLLIERLNNLAADEQYLLIYRWAECGNGAAHEIRFDDNDVTGCRMRIARVANLFWLENASAEDRFVVGGVTVVTSGCTFPLAPGMRVACGDMTLNVEPFAQVGL